MVRILACHASGCRFESGLDCMKQSEIDLVVLYHVILVVLSWILGAEEILGLMFSLYVMVYFLNFWLMDKYDNFRKK